MAQPFDLPSLDLAALICSRVCHDVISPVGAIANGLEVLDEDDSGDMREVALELIRSSARSASVRLQFARLAFGFGGSVGAEIDLAEAERVARGYIEGERTRLDWRLAPGLMAKDRVKLLLTLVALSTQAIPRGGLVAAGADGDRLTVTASGPGARVPPGLDRLFAGDPEAALDAHTVVGFYAGLLAKAAGLGLSIVRDGDAVTLVAAP
jgi:histidine phosphotransferase ChpT